ncbi:MAG: hypothetical protein OEY55_15940, partial [Acidimicrobiia bacterium]|nr:hypothetical protein [Acidimicrobiia bacterium]
MPNTIRLLVAFVAALPLAACSAGVASSTIAPTPSVPASSSSVVPDRTAPAPPSTSVTTTTVSVTTTTLDDTVVIGVSVVGGELVSERRAEVKLGDKVKLVVESDTADEIHVHGYDLIADLVPGEITELTFVAEIPGIFEVEFETSHMQVLELVVN